MVCCGCNPVQHVTRLSPIFVGSDNFRNQPINLFGSLQGWAALVGWVVVPNAKVETSFLNCMINLKNSSNFMLAKTLFPQIDHVAL